MSIEATRALFGRPSGASLFRLASEQRPSLLRPTRAVKAALASEGRCVQCARAASSSASSSAPMLSRSALRASERRRIGHAAGFFTSAAARAEPAVTDQQLRSPYLDHPDPAIRLAANTLDVPGALSEATLQELDPSSEEYIRKAKDLSDQQNLRETWRKWKQLQQNIASAEDMLANESDEEMKSLVREEIEGIESEQDSVRESLFQLLFPEEPLHSSGAIIELRLAIGGAESAIFTGEMTRMYERFCARREGWSVQRLSSIEGEFSSASSSGSSPGKYIREAILQVDGPGAYGDLRFEAGIHRVQRVPETIAINKLQSSTMTVVVLPAEQAQASRSGGGGGAAEYDDLVDPKDVKTEVMRARGAGGQHVNKTESAIRLTHTPSGITVSMQDSRSQHANRERAWAILRARLLDRRMKEEQERARAMRGEQIVGLNRGDRVRTYNYAQDRVTDHRIHMSVGGLAAFMEGGADVAGLQDMIDELKNQERRMFVDARLAAIAAKAAQQQKEEGAGSGKKGKGK